MKTPEPKVEPKSREVLWRETVFGGVVFFAGFGTLGSVVVRGHKDSLLLIIVAAAMMSAGAFFTNKKLTKEWLVELRETVPFLRRKE